MKKVPFFILLTALICPALPAAQAAPAPAAKAKISKDLNNLDSSGTLDVIVQYKVPPTEVHYNRAHALGAVDKRRYSRLNHAAYTIPANALQALASDPDVKFISPDRKVRSHLAVTAPTIHADLAWQMGYTGTGIGVAVIDSGVAPDDKDLSANTSSVFPNGITGTTKPQGAFPAGGNSRIIFAEDFLQPATSGDRWHARDDYGHGTHVAGIIAGNATQSTGNNFIKTYKGIAPNANIISFRVLDENGEGSDSTVIAAIDQAIALQSTLNIRIINLSLGRPVTESFVNDPLCQAVEQAWQAGMVVVVAAGNDGRDDSFENNGYGTISAPGNDPYVLTVGAMKTALTTTRTDDGITTYSSKGPTPVDHIVKPDIVAPGNGIVAALQKGTLVQQYPQNFVSALVYESNGHPNDPSSYFTLNGTSMATGVVSGAVADLLQAQPNLTPDQVKALLMLTSTKNFNGMTSTYYSATSDAAVMQVNLATAQFTLASLQQSAQQAQNQLTNDQQTLANDTAHMQSDNAKIPLDQQAITTAQNAVPAVQTNSNSAAAAYTTAQAALTSAQTTLSNAQAALKTAQQKYGGNSPQAQAAQAAQQSAQTALNNAQNAANSAHTTANQAAQALQQAQQAVQQAQNQLTSDQQHYAQDQTQVAQDQAKIQADTTALQSANQAVTNEQNQISAWNQELTTDQQTSAQLMVDPPSFVYDIFTVGAGYLDLNAALTSTNIPPANTVAISPVAFIDPTDGQVYATGNYGAVCGNANLGGSSTSPLVGSTFCSVPAFYSASAIWQFSSSSASQSVSGTRAVWGAQSVWGNAAMSSTQSVWGNRCVWGAQSVWGNSSNEAFQTLWSTQSVWGNSTNDADATDNATSVLISGDPGM